MSEVGLIAHVCNRGLACVVVRGNARASVRVWFDSEWGEGTGVKERTAPPSESHWSERVRGTFRTLHSARRLDRHNKGVSVSTTDVGMNGFVRPCGWMRTQQIRCEQSGWGLDRCCLNRRLRCRPAPHAHTLTFFLTEHHHPREDHLRVRGGARVLHDHADRGVGCGDGREQ